jgi:hypothetical protein
MELHESEEDARAEILADPSVRSGVFECTLSGLVPFFTGCVPVDSLRR